MSSVEEDEILNENVEQVEKEMEEEESEANTDDEDEENTDDEEEEEESEANTDDEEEESEANTDEEEEEEEEESEANTDDEEEEESEEITDDEDEITDDEEDESEAITDEEEIMTEEQKKLAKLPLKSLPPLDIKLKNLPKSPEIKTFPKLVVLEKPITIQEVSKEEIEETISPKPRKKKEDKKKKTIQISTKKVAKSEELSIVQRENETNEDFLMRKAYTLASEKVFPKYPASTHILLGDMAVNRAKYNMTYPQETDVVLDYIDNYILNT